MVYPYDRVYKAIYFMFLSYCNGRANHYMQIRFQKSKTKKLSTE